MMPPMTGPLLRSILLQAIGVAIVAGSGCANGTSKSSLEIDAPPVPRDSGPIDPVPDARPDGPAPVPDAAIAPPDACVPVASEKLANPVFDLAPPGTGWVDGRDPATNALSGGPFPIISANPAAFAAHSAPHKAWFGGAAGSQVSPPKASLTDTLYQDFAIPANATLVVVTGYYAVGSTELAILPFDTFSLDIVETNGTPIENALAISNMTVADTFTAFSKTLALGGVAGKTVRLRASSINDNTNHTNFFLDSLSVKATACP
jgi:hypothetical protein